MQCCDRFLYYYILTVISPHQPFQNRTIPCLVLNLPPLSKGGGLTARHKLLHYCVCLRYICLFLFTKLFCRQDGGIAFLPHPFRFSDTSANNHSIVGSASHCNRSSPLHKGAKGDTALSTFPKPHYPFALHHILASLVKGRWIDGKAQTVPLLRFTCDISVFFYLPNFSAVKTEGLPSYRTLSVSLTPPLTITQ